MKILIIGVCGFIGSTLSAAIARSDLEWEVIGIDNLARAGIAFNRIKLIRQGFRLLHGDLRCQSDVDTLPAVDWIIDAATNPSVLAGTDGLTSSPQLMEHNLCGSLNLLEKCRRDGAGFILLSTSRVYSIATFQLSPLRLQMDASNSAPAQLYRLASLPRVSPNHLTQVPQSLSTVPASLPVKHLPSSMAVRSASPSGSTAVAFSLGQGSLAEQTKASSPTG